MEIKSSIVRDVCYKENEDDLNDEWRFIESKITSNDAEDGGAHYEAVMQEKATEKFYKAFYNDWDFHWEYSDWEEDDEERTIDNGETMEVQPVKQVVVTTTVYK